METSVYRIEITLKTDDVYEIKKKKISGSSKKKFQISSHFF